MTRRALIVSGAIVLLVVAGVAALLTRAPASGETPSEIAVSGSPERPPLDTAAVAPAGVRIRVQVLNGSGRTGLARRATQRLRDHGYDVVDYDSRGTSTSLTEVQVTSASRAWGDRVALALGGGSVREREGDLGYVDVVVLLGHDWKPAPQALRP